MIQYRSINEASDYILNLLKEFISANTIFIATNDGITNTVLKAFNRQEHLIEEGSALPLLQSYGSFIEVPIATRDNEAFGTICAIDRKDISFSEKEISLLEAMAALISYAVELENMTVTDSLTGSYNRKFLEKVYDKSESGLIDHPLTLLFIDLDNFKMVNDLYGHDIGDQVLMEVVARLKKQLRKTDKIVRVGGDEFLLIIDQPMTDEEGKLIVEKILSSFDEPVSLDHQMIQVSISVGISSSQEANFSLDTLIQKADTAMYEIK